MNTGVMFLDCPAYMDQHGMARCGLPAAVEYRYAVSSTDGPLESAKSTQPDLERIRLRMALHAGEVNYDEHGVTAAAITKENMS